MFGANWAPQSGNIWILQSPLRRTSLNTLLMKNLINDVWNNLARVEIWEDGRFSRLCVELDRRNPAAYELIVGPRAKTVGLVLRWRLPVTVGSMAVCFASFKDRIHQPFPNDTSLERWDGVQWKKIQTTPVVDDSGVAHDAFYRRSGYVRWVCNFPAVVTEQLRFQIHGKAGADNGFQTCILRDLECFEGAIAVRRRSGASVNRRFVGKKVRRPFSEREICKIDLSGMDRLGKRICARAAGADYESVAALLLPMDFYKSAIGRINAGNETLVTWNGTLIMVEGVEDAAWNHYSEKSMAIAWKDQLVLVMEGMERCVDRWFAFAVGKGGELVGSDLNRTKQEWIDGFKPGMRTIYQQGGLSYTFSAFVTAEKSESYLNIVEVEVANHSGRQVDTEVAVVMGKHASEAMHETRNPAAGPRFDPSINPLFFAPQPTGYKLERSGCVVRGKDAEIVLGSSRRGRLGGNDRERVFTVPLKIAPGGKRTLHFSMPGVAAPLRRAGVLKAPEKRLPAFKDFWAKTLTGKARIETPEKRVNDFQKNAIAQVLITLLNNGKLKYGSYWYEEYYGPEEAEAVVALAKCGYLREAKMAVEIILSPELLDPNGYHHQYRHGVAVQAAAEVYFLEGDKAWLERIAPRLVAIGDWIIRAIHSETGRFAGLLPKRTYGGDIRTPARNLSTNARCWRGLRDAGLLLRELGRNTLADRFLEEAGRYRERILRLVRAVTDHDRKHPFVPMGLDIGQKGSENYRETETAYDSLSQQRMGAFWHIFGAWMLRSGIFDVHSAEVRWITDYIEKKGGLLLGLLRLGKNHGPQSMALDTHYGLGYIQTLLARGEREKFLVSFYGMLAHGMSRNTFSSPESSLVVPLRTDPVAWNRMFLETMWEWGANRNPYLTEPLSSGASAVLLSLLRDMLLREETIQKKTILHLLGGVPSGWLAPGKEIVIKRAPTRHGMINLRAGVAHDGSLRIEINPQWRTKPDEICLHLHPPARGKMAEVRLNGRPWTAVGGNQVRLRPDDAAIRLDVRFK